MSEALHTRGLLEERYSALCKRIETASEPEERKRLLLELDSVVGERLALEGDHAEEFRTHDRQFVEARFSTVEKNEGAVRAPFFRAFLLMRSALRKRKMEDALPQATPMRNYLEDALREFRKALREQVGYTNEQNIREAYNGAADFVDFLLEGPESLRGRKGRPRRA